MEYYYLYIVFLGAVLLWDCHLIYKEFKSIKEENKKKGRK